jgi:hypothetical protein
VESRLIWSLEPADDRPEDDDGREALGERHCERTDRIADQPEHEGPLATHEISDLAADQYESGRYQRLQRDRRLHSTHTCVQIVDHREIDTFINEVSTTKKNIAIASTTARRLLPDVTASPCIAHQMSYTKCRAKRKDLAQLWGSAVGPVCYVGPVRPVTRGRGRKSCLCSASDIPVWQDLLSAEFADRTTRQYFGRCRQ